MNEIFKAYDIRGVYPEQINKNIAIKIGRAVADYLRTDKICVGRDMRVSSPEIAEGLIQGIIMQGTDVVDLGQVSTDMVYFATGNFGYGGGIMVTASHNPGEWNGLKMCGAKAAPISSDNGLPDIKLNVEKNIFKTATKIGKVKSKDIYDDWINFAMSFVEVEKIRPFKIAIDAGNGMAGKVIPSLVKKMPQIEILPMYFELDGTFPNHLASPIEPENTADLRKKVVAENCNFGLAFDGDADRVFFADNNGDMLSGTVVTAMIAEIIIKKNPGCTILYNAICGKIVPETINKLGANCFKTRVGHSLIKARMQETGALFAGEHSGHYYFKENYNADSALIATLIVMELVSVYNQELSELNNKYSKYYASGELNSEVKDIKAKLLDLKNKYSNAKMIDDLDGLSFYYDNYWFNVRPSNTEPLLRLNLEADTIELLKNKTAEVLSAIRSQ